MSFALKVTVAGIDVTNYAVDGNSEDDLSLAISQATLKINKTVDGSLTIASGQAVKIWRSYTGSYLDSELEFEGQVDNIVEENYVYTMTCYDLLNLTNKANVSHIYLSTDSTAGKLSAIFLDLINSHTSLTANSSSVQDSGTTITLSQFPCLDSYAYNRIQQLGQALNWRYYYNPKDHLVHFEPIRYTANGTPIDYNNLVAKPVWEEDKTELANAITVKGGSIQTQAIESFAGPASSVTLANKPDSMSVTVGGVLKKGGQPSDSGIDYYYDKESMTVTFLVSSSTIVVTYFFSSPLPLYSVNSASIATYGLYQKVIAVDDAKSITDLQNRLVTALSLYSFPFKIATAEVRNSSNYNYQVGQSVKITDPYTAQTGTYTIRKITKNLRKFQDEIELGDKEFRLEAWMAYQLNDRITALEQQSTTPGSLATTLVQFQHTPIVKRTSMKMTITRINDSFILGHDGDNGKLGRGKILDDFEVSPLSNWTGTNCAITVQLDT